MNLKKLLWSLTHRPITSADDLWRRHALFGEMNEFFGRQVVSSDGLHYTLPFLANPARESAEKKSWQELDNLHWEYVTDEEKAEANRRFGVMWSMLENRVAKDDVIFDVGCNTGYYLQKFHEAGFTDLHGIDPAKMCVAYAREHRPHLDIREGFFGPPENDLECDVMVFFGSIFRIPYRSRLFDAIDRCARKYVALQKIQEMDDFSRDLHYRMARKGFICIEKKVLDLNYIPIGYPAADGPIVRLHPTAPNRKDHRNFVSNFLFRRVEPRPRPER